jgi:hypothetical protein
VTALVDALGRFIAAVARGESLALRGADPMRPLMNLRFEDLKKIRDYFTEQGKGE